MAKQKQHTWVTEDEAARMIGFRPRTVRRYAKINRLPINYTSMNGKRYQYSKEDIDKLLMDNSTVLR